MATVPNVVGMTLEQAYKILNQGESFRVTSKGKSFCRVTKQEPAAGQNLARCETVRLCCMVQVPQLVHTDFAQGLDKLKELDLFGKQLATAYQGDVVFSQNPAAGKWVEVESIVSLMPGLAMPDLRGPFTEARRILLQAGMLGYLNNVRSIPTAGGTNGEVTIDWQSIVPQTIVPRSRLVRVSGSWTTGSAPDSRCGCASFRS